MNKLNMIGLPQFTLLRKFTFSEYNDGYTRSKVRVAAVP